jgi:hypothetical protein
MMDDTIIRQFYTAHARSTSQNFPGSRFGMHTGTSMNASISVMDWRSRFGIPDASCSGMRRSSWSWGTPVRPPSNWRLNTFTMSPQRYAALYRPRSFTSIQFDP